MTEEKLPYLTEAQEEYLRDREESKKYANPFKANQRWIEKCWADLEQPEASWDLADLIAYYAIFLAKMAARRG